MLPVTDLQSEIFTSYRMILVCRWKLPLFFGHKGGKRRNLSHKMVTCKTGSLKVRTSSLLKIHFWLNRLLFQNPFQPKRGDPNCRNIVCCQIGALSRLERDFTKLLQDFLQKTFCPTDRFQNVCIHSQSVWQRHDSMTMVWVNWKPPDPSEQFARGYTGSVLVFQRSASAWPALALHSCSWGFCSSSTRGCWPSETWVFRATYIKPLSGKWDENSRILTLALATPAGVIWCGFCVMTVVWPHLLVQSTRKFLFWFWSEVTEKS